MLSGPARFLLPQPAEPWTELRDATAAGSPVHYTRVCYQVRTLPPQLVLFSCEAHTTRLVV